MIRDRQFIPAPFVGLLADMPAATAPAAARQAWLGKTHRALFRSLYTSHGLEAVRLACVINRELRTLTGGAS